MNMDRLPSILLEAAGRYRGPAGAVAVFKDGQLAGQHVWGFANLDERTPMAATTSIPICSISKQMVCAVLLDLLSNPTPAMTAAAPDGDLAKLFTDKMHDMLGLEFCQKNGLAVEHLCHNQSGIRDYWAETVLWGSKPDGPYSVEKDAADMRKRIKSLHFAPGTEFSYANTNFHLLARIIEQVTGESISDLLDKRIFEPAGMATARLCPETVEHNKYCVGYEGDEQRGYYVAVNRMEWSGDAGIVASLEDMVAYEKYLHGLASKPQSWYATAVEGPRTFADGNVSSYRYGLMFQELEGGVKKIGHTGGLRGYRLSRTHLPAQGLSVVVLLNHECPAPEVSDFIVKKLLGINTPETPLHQLPEPAKEWAGSFFDEGTQMAIIGTVTDGKKVTLSYSRASEPIKLTSEKQGGSPAMTASIDGDVLRIQRISDNRVLEAKRLDAAEATLKDTSGFTGTYVCDEIGSTVHITGQGGILYGSFDGPLGQGPPHLARHVGGDVWMLACHRSLDAPAPGDWTLAYHRNDKGDISGVTIGCWLARRLDYVKA
jgi:CubicO group peptidase (beta-lactamase class C family)